MADGIASLSAALLAAAALWFALSRVTAAVAGRLLPLLAAVAAPARARALLLIALYPALLAGIVAAVVFLVPLSGLLVERHCHAGLGCAAHAPRLAVPDAVAPWLGGAVLLVCAALLGAAVVALRRRAGIAATLSRLAREGAGGACRVLDSAAPRVACVGLLRQTVLISRGLLDVADAAETEVHLLHAHAHRLRYDNLRVLAGAFAMTAWPRAARSRLLEALMLAADESCDTALLQAGVDTAVVRRAIAAQRRWPTAAASGQAARLEARLAALELPAAPDPVSPRLLLAAVCGTLPLLTLPAGVHHLFEALLPLA